MKICQSKKFVIDGGDYCILSDFDSEGFGIEGQYKTLEEAIGNIGGSCGSPQTIVKLVGFDIKENDE